jgi:hypothetical protein
MCTLGYRILCGTTGICVTRVVNCNGVCHLNLLPCLWGNHCVLQGFGRFVRGAVCIGVGVGEWGWWSTSGRWSGVGCGPTSLALPCVVHSDRQ